MKKALSLLLALLLMMSVCAWAETPAPETRSSTVMIEGMEEEIIETRFVSDAGYSLWYQADLFHVDANDGQAFFFALPSTPEGEEPGLLTSESYLLVVPVDIDPAEADVMLDEAVGGYVDTEAIIGEVVEIPLESGIELKSVSVQDGDTMSCFYLVKSEEKVLCVTAFCTLEGIEGWGTRFDAMVKSIEF